MRSWSGIMDTAMRTPRRLACASSLAAASHSSALANSDQLSASSLLGHGDVLASPVAVSFVKHFVSPGNAPLASPDYDAATAALEQHLDGLRRGGASAIYDDEVFAQALARDYLGRRDSREDSRAKDLLRWLLHKSPGRLGRADTATLNLLLRQSDPELLAPAGPLLELLLAREPENPEVLAAAVQYHEKSGHEGQAVDVRRRLAALKGYEDDSRKQEAALWLGKHLSRTDPDLARAYLWNARTWSFNSGNDDLGVRVTRAIDELRQTRGTASPRPSSDAPRPRETPPQGKTLRQPFRRTFGRRQSRRVPRRCLLIWPRSRGIKRCCTRA